MSFTIPFITVINPTSGVVWAPSSLHDITWISSGTSGYVNIDFYNGISYSSIATGVSASLGTYNWFVPAISSGTYQIYIEIQQIQILTIQVHLSSFLSSL